MRKRHPPLTRPPLPPPSPTVPEEVQSNRLTVLGLLILSRDAPPPTGPLSSLLPPAAPPSLTNPRPLPPFHLQWFSPLLGQPPILRRPSRNKNKMQHRVRR